MSNRLFYLTECTCMPKLGLLFCINELCYQQNYVIISPIGIFYLNSHVLLCQCLNITVPLSVHATVL